MHSKANEKERAIIAQHLDLSGPDLAALIEKECNLILSPASCTRIAADVREREALKVDAALAVIENNIAEWMKIKTPTYLKYLDDNILQIVNMINNKDDYCVDAKGKFSADAFQKLSKLLGDQISVLMKIGGKQSPGDAKAGSRDDSKSNVIVVLDDIMNEYWKSQDEKRLSTSSSTNADFTIIDEEARKATLF